MGSAVVEEDHSNIIMVIKNRSNFHSPGIFKNRVDVHFSKNDRAIMFLRRIPGVCKTPCYAQYPPRGTMDNGFELLS